MKILNTIGDVYTPAAREILGRLGDVEYRIPSQTELPAVLGGFDVAVVGLGLTFSKEVLAAALDLKVIATATTGLDHIDAAFAKEWGIEILSLRGENEFLDTITGTAELSFGLMIDLLRKTPWAFSAVKRHEWNREAFRGRNLFGLTLGVVGMGRLGKWMARYGVAAGMRVLFYDPSVTESPVAGAVPVPFDELLKESDVVSIHVHLTPETDNLFNAATLAKMKRGAYLVNTSRGKIVNEADLLAALQKGEIGGYGTDVLANELSFGKTFAGDPLVEYATAHENVIVVPHIGGMTVESRERTDVFIAEKLARFLTRG